MRCWELNAEGLMAVRIAAINDLMSAERDRQYHSPTGQRSDDHPSLSAPGLETRRMTSVLSTVRAQIPTLVLSSGELGNSITMLQMFLDEEVVTRELHVIEVAAHVKKERIAAQTSRRGRTGGINVAFREGSRASRITDRQRTL